VTGGAFQVDVLLVQLESGVSLMIKGQIVESAGLGMAFCAVDVLRFPKLRNVWIVVAILTVGSGSFPERAAVLVGTVGSLVTVGTLSGTMRSHQFETGPFFVIKFASSNILETLGRMTSSTISSFFNCRW
jgi:hypothetical protein